MKQILCLKGALCSFLNQIKYKRAIASKLFALSFALTSLFCVCLAHAGQRGLGNPAATGVALQTVYPVTGKVFDHENNPLEGATINIEGTRGNVFTDSNGNFRVLTTDTSGTLLISHIGYQTVKVNFSRREAGPFSIKLESNGVELEEVHVNTGYQTLPKERSTGSFVQVDNELLNRRVSTNILDRLDGVTSGLIFNNNGNKQARQSEIQIRGRATLFANADPLVVVDNFPYEGDISNINPNDVASITVLKDAAAASAWGAFSGNGVIVITTKQGQLKSAPKVGFNANVNIAQKPDLFYTPQLTSGEYIDIEQFLFQRGAYNNTINNGYAPLSPAVEIFLKGRSGLISSNDSLEMISKLKDIDVRDQLLEHLYQNSINQQYQLNVSGGSQNQRYYFSAGYDKNLPSQIRNSSERITLNASNTYFFLNGKLELFSNILYTAGKSKTIPSFSPAYPYDQIADEEGNALRIVRDLRFSYIDTAGNDRLLDWSYRPLDELRNNYQFSQTDANNYRINLSLGYDVLPHLKAKVLYTYQKSNNVGFNHYDSRSYYTRHLINMYSTVNWQDGSVSSAVPYGSIRIDNIGESSNKSGRFQLDYNDAWGRNEIAAITGIELRDGDNMRSSYGLYGYNTETATNQNTAVNFNELYPIYYRNTTGRVPTNTSQSGSTDRFVSMFFNGSYTYDTKYILSASARKDESNLFGVKANQKGIPLWSAGLAWILSNEDFYKSSWLTNLKWRATYGYTGNVDKSISAYLTALRGGLAQMYNAYYTEIVNPPNPSLKWERVKNLNLGVDFAIFDNRISGSVEYWLKEGIDLIGDSPIAPQTGIVLFRGNSAHTRTKGLDLVLNTVNTKGLLKWNTDFLLNYNNDKVVTYDVESGTNYSVVSSNAGSPLVGYPLYGLFSYRYAGLNNEGSPQGVLDNEVSTNYSAIRNSMNRENLVYHGSAVPTTFGSLRNSFSIRGFELSFNILFKLGYYFRRESLNNTAIYAINSSGAYMQPDYDRRWKQPGDELFTQVPALVYPSVLNRSSLYQYADILVEKGDHVRLQDFRMGYTFYRSAVLPFSRLHCYTYVNNVGVLWRANKRGIDPDYPTSSPAPRTIAFGVAADF